MKNFFKNVFEKFREYFVVVTLLIVSLSILSFNSKPEIRKIKSYSFGTFAVFNSVVSNVINLFGEKKELDELRKMNAELMLRVNKLREHGLENVKLKKLLGFKDSINTPLIPAKVISTLISKTQGNFIINAGRVDSVRVGMPVITEEGLVGVIHNVSEDYSLVRTLYNSSFRIAVRNQSTNVDGILGWDGTTLVINNIPTTYDMNPGDRIISSDFSTLVPPQIPVGLVTKKENSVSGLLSNIIVKPFVNLRAVRDVFVMGIVPDKQIKKLESRVIK